MSEHWLRSAGESGSLRGRLLRRLAVLLALILMLSSLSAYWSARQAADTAYDRTLLASARAIADGLYTTAERLNANVPYVALDVFAYDSEGRIFYQVSDLQGRLVSVPGTGFSTSRSTPPSSRRGRRRTFPDCCRVSGGRWTVAGRPASAPGRPRTTAGRPCLLA